MVPDGPSLLFVSSPFSCSIRFPAGNANSCTPTVLIILSLHSMLSQIGFLRLGVQKKKRFPRNVLDVYEVYK